VELVLVSPEYVTVLKLQVICDAYTRAVSYEHLSQPGYTHLDPNSIREGYINDILGIGLASPYDQAKELFDKSLKYFTLLRKSNRTKG